MNEAIQHRLLAVAAIFFVACLAAILVLASPLLMLTVLVTGWPRRITDADRARFPSPPFPVPPTKTTA